MPDRNISRRSLLRSVGAAGAASTAGTQFGVAAAEAVSELEKESLPEAEVQRIVRTLERSSSYREILARVHRAVRGPLHRTEATGSRVAAPDQDGLRTVYVGFETNIDDLEVGVVWADSPEEQRLFGHVAGTGAALNDVPRILQNQASLSTSPTDGDRVRIQRFIRPDSDTATAIVLPGGTSDGEIGPGDLESFNRVDVETETVTTLSQSSFADCFLENAGGIITGAGACAYSCRDGCLRRPNYLGCLVCAGCSLAAGCYAGECADEHLSGTVCDAALLDCAFPFLVPGGGGCAIAYGCLVGHCSVL